MRVDFQPNPTGDSPITTAKPPARYSAMESARAGDFANLELHHPSDNDQLGVSIYLSAIQCSRKNGA